MTVYEHKSSLTTASGSVSSVTLNIPGGLLKYLLVRANTSTTVFRTEIVDDNDITRLNYGFHTGEIMDNTVSLPVTSNIKVNITNVGPADDTFQLIIAVQE